MILDLIDSLCTFEPGIAAIVVPLGKRSAFTSSGPQAESSAQDALERLVKDAVSAAIARFTGRHCCPQCGLEIADFSNRGQVSSGLAFTPQEPEIRQFFRLLRERLRRAGVVEGGR